MKATLLTIGYEGVTIEDFIATLKAADVQLLLDVRDFPGSRKKGFSKNQLSKTLSSHRINYIHLKGLGDPKEGRDAARSGNKDKFLKIFFSHMKTDIAQLDLERAVQLVVENSSCLMCYERSHIECHRSIISTLISDITDQKIQHLGVPLDAAKRFKNVETRTEFHTGAIG